MVRLSSRRKFIEQCFQSGVVVLILGLTSNSCNTKKSDKENKKQLDSCDDFSEVSEAELEKRKKFAYVKQANDTTKPCNLCKLFLPPKPGEKCGSCQLFKGPVDANGSCTYWAPLD